MPAETNPWDSCGIANGPCSRVGLGGTPHCSLREGSNVEIFTGLEPVVRRDSNWVVMDE